MLIPTHTRKPLSLLAAASLSLGAVLQTQAQTAAKSGAEVVTMEKFKVTDVPIDKQILPTSRPFNSVFGTDDNIVDVPRNVTIISRQQLSDIAISSVLDFSKLTSSAYTTTNFGAPANPSWRLPMPCPATRRSTTPCSATRSRSACCRTRPSG